jgi:hypothetical protein
MIVVISSHTGRCSLLLYLLRYRTIVVCIMYHCSCFIIHSRLIEHVGRGNAQAAFEPPHGSPHLDGRHDGGQECWLGNQRQLPQDRVC